MKYRVFVDGQEGTTGLKIRERLAGRQDLEIMTIPEAQRKDTETRRRYLNEADLVFLCLPDAAAKESVAMVRNDRTRIIDASTAHRTDPAWTYGLPELGAGQRRAVQSASRVSVPGCHATGFVLALYPLVTSGVMPADYPVTCHSITGYSGGGKKLIGEYQSETRPASYAYPRPYALGLCHKHLPEMRYITGLTAPPLFTPILGDFYQGMAVAVPIIPRLLTRKLSAGTLQAMLASYYENERFVKVIPFVADAYLENGCFDPTACNDSNQAEIFVFGHEEQILIITRLDNLGKGSSGAAVQNMNLMLGLDEGLGL